MTDALTSLPALPARLRWVRLGPEDLNRVESLHRACAAGLPPRVVKPETHAFLAAMLGSRGEGLGIEEEDHQLIAYGFLQHDLLPQDDLRPALGLSAATPIAKLAGAAVAPSHRGHSLQRSLIRARASLASPQHLLFATASPFNAPSWANLLSAGFPIRRLEYRYGGVPRFIHARVPAGMPPLQQDGWQDVAGDDLPAHERLLANEYIGVSVTARDSVRYHREASAS